MSDTEKKWLGEHAEMRLGIDPSWPPFEFLDSLGGYQGIASDYVTILENQMSVVHDPGGRIELG